MPPPSEHTHAPVRLPRTDDQERRRQRRGAAGGLSSAAIGARIAGALRIMMPLMAAEQKTGGGNRTYRSIIYTWVCQYGGGQKLPAPGDAKKVKAPADPHRGDDAAVARWYRRRSGASSASSASSTS
jgi:hypothetical protein